MLFKDEKKKLPSLDYFTCQHHNRLLKHFLTNLNGKFDVVHVVAIMQSKSPLTKVPQISDIHQFKCYNFCLVQGASQHYSQVIQNFKLKSSF